MTLEEARKVGDIIRLCADSPLTLRLALKHAVACFPRFEWLQVDGVGVRVEMRIEPMR